MIRGYYAAVAGMVTAVSRMEVLIHNLANLETPGYKQERTASTTFAETLVEQAALQNTLPPLVLSNAARSPDIDFSQGAAHATGRTLDVALQGAGFLVAEGPDGVVYTRDGSLVRDAEGYLATGTGKRILGETGPIRIPDGPMAIGADGSVSVGEQRVGRLQIVEFAQDQPLQRVGSNELVLRSAEISPREAVETTVLQGFIEASNVDLTATITSMLELQRAYEANQRMIRYQDELLGRLVTDVAQPAS